MEILLTNDDGIFAPGLFAIYKELSRLGGVTVVAPAEAQSGAGHRITLTDAPVCTEVDILGQFVGFSVRGSPADCVKLAFTQLCKGPPDLLVSGINHGANVGINVYYSGTVAAAVEGAFFKIPSVAMSLAGETGVDMDYEAAAAHCVKILEKLLPIKAGEIININIPQLSKGPPKGVMVVPQATGGFDDYYLHDTNATGKAVFLSTDAPPPCRQTRTDITALFDGFITITPLIHDMTDHKKMPKLEKMKFDDD